MVDGLPESDGPSADRAPTFCAVQGRSPLGVVGVGAVPVVTRPENSLDTEALRTGVTMAAAKSGAQAVHESEILQRFVGCCDACGHTFLQCRCNAGTKG
jgi:hypothetical protein